MFATFLQLPFVALPLYFGTAFKSTAMVPPRSTSYQMASVDWRFRDTTKVPEPALVPLTDELIENYLAVRQEVFAYVQVHPAMLNDIPVRMYRLTMCGPGGMVQGYSQISLVDFALLATKNPTVAALFVKHHVQPAQFAPVTMTLRKALFASALHKVKGWAVKDPTSVEGKNIQLVEAHLHEFVNSPLAQVALERAH